MCWVANSIWNRLLKNAEHPEASKTWCWFLISWVLLTISLCSSVKVSCNKKTWKNDFHSIQFCDCHTSLEFHSLAPQATSTLNNSTACMQAGSNKTLELTSNSQRQMTATKVFHLNGKGFTIKLALQNSLNHPTLILHVATVGSMHLSLIGSQAGRTFKCHLIGWWTGCRSSLSWKGDIKIDQDFRTKNSTKSTAPSNLERTFFLSAQPILFATLAGRSAACRLWRWIQDIFSGVRNSIKTKNNCFKCFGYEFSDALQLIFKVSKKWL